MQVHVYNLICFVLVFLLEIYIAIFVHDNFIRPFVGDMLVVILLYFFVRIFYVKNRKKVILGVLLFAYLVEILQFFNIIELVWIENKVLRIAIGSVFDWKDIISYTVWAMILILFEKNMWK